MTNKNATTYKKVAYGVKGRKGFFRGNSRIPHFLRFFRLVADATVAAKSCG
jgi:hypothetical protein